MSIIEFLCVLALGYVIGNLHTIWKLRKIISDVAKDQDIDLDNSPNTTATKQDIYNLEIEAVGDVLYLYDTDTKDFVCQGASLAELATYSKNYKKIMLATVKHNDKVFMFVNGNYKEFIG